MKMNKMREKMASSFLRALKQESIPWRRSWTQLRPVNAVNSNTYHGVNMLWLSFVQETKGYKDPRWCTFKQAQTAGWHVKKGEKGTPIEFWSLYDLKQKQKLTNYEAEILRENLTLDDYHNRVKPVSSVYTVFNAEQIEGVPELTMGKFQLDKSRIEDIRDRLIQNMDVGFRTGGESAFYRPGEDCIHMPAMERFQNEYGYLSVFLHEAGHATGHNSRLNREKGNAFGSPEYAREELRAEIASAFTSQILKLPGADESQMENHKAYIQSWIKVLEDNPNELFSAIKDAEKISDYLIEKGEFVQDNEKLLKEDSFSDFVKEHGKIVHENSTEIGKTTIVINAFGGPGSGKTTSCLDICAQLKKAGYNAEYVQEVAKELVYENRMDLLDGSEAHQFDMLKEQMKRMDRLVGKTDFIVTDSPILLNAIYNQELTAAYNNMVSQLHGQYDNFSFFMKRDEAEFKQEGRIHNLEQSREKDREIRDMLKERNIYYGTYTHDTIGVVVKNAIENFNNLSEKKEKAGRRKAEQGKRFYTKEEREKMTAWIKSNIRIVDVCSSLGYSPVRVGQKYYTLKEHDSVRIDMEKNCFFWNSTGEKGSVIDACSSFGNLEKAETYQYLYDMAGGRESVYESALGHRGRMPETQKKEMKQEKMVPDDKEIEPKKVVLPKKGCSCRNVYAYLGKSRKISGDVISEFIKKNMLYQDEKNNCVFVSRDERGEPVFACRRGTNTYNRFVGDCPGNDYSKGFYVDNGAGKLFVAESIIDIMSKMTLLQKEGLDYHDYNYLALAGTQKQDPIRNIIKENPQIKEVSIGLDNDKGGWLAAANIEKMVTGMGVDIRVDMPEKSGQDWNDVLCSREEQSPGEGMNGSGGLLKGNQYKVDIFSSAKEKDNGIWGNQPKMKAPARMMPGVER